MLIIHNYIYIRGISGVLKKIILSNSGLVSEVECHPYELLLFVYFFLPIR